MAQAYKTVRGYTLLEDLGSGLFGVVYLARRNDGQMCAVKIPDEKCADKQKYDKADLDALQTELDHENLVRIQEVFKHEDHLYIAMQFCDGGDLNEYFVKNKPEMQERLDFMVDMCRGLHYLHERYTIHCNIKPENVLLKHNGDRFMCKISDFGMSRIKATRQEMFHIYVGHPAYKAPEIHDGNYSKASDVYSLGLLFYAVVNCTVLQDISGVDSLVAGVLASNGNVMLLNVILKKKKPSKTAFLANYCQNFDPELGAVIYLMLNHKPESRPCIEKVLVKIQEKAHYMYIQTVIELVTERNEVVNKLNAYKEENDGLKSLIEAKDKTIKSQAEHLRSLNIHVRSLEEELRTKEVPNMERFNMYSRRLSSQDRRSSDGEMDITETTESRYLSRKVRSLSKRDLWKATHPNVSRERDASLPKLFLDLQTCDPPITYVDRVLALPDGGALVVTQKQTKDIAIRLDKRGAIVATVLAPPVPITSLVWIIDDVLILLADGEIWRLTLGDCKATQACTVEVGHLIDGVCKDEDNLYLLDNERGEVFSYQLSRMHKDVKIGDLNHPTSIQKINTQDGMMIIVCECAGNAIHMYMPEKDSVWYPIRSISGWGYADGQVMLPYSVAILPNNNLLVADCGNSRITEYDQDCGFLRHILKEEDGIYEPTALSYEHPLLWVVHKYGETSRQLKCYRLK